MENKNLKYLDISKYIDNELLLNCNYDFGDKKNKINDEEIGVGIGIKETNFVLYVIKN